MIKPAFSLALSLSLSLSFLSFFSPHALALLITPRNTLDTLVTLLVCRVKCDTYRAGFLALHCQTFTWMATLFEVH